MFGGVSSALTQFLERFRWPQPNSSRGSVRAEPLLAGFATPEPSCRTSSTVCGRRCCLGDHCSPISDTTILSSTGSGANVMTLTIQLPYALASAATALLGYVVYALTSNGWLGLLTALCFLGLGPGARRCCSPPGGGSSAGGAG
ncbi:hypothetical protein FNH13_06380 [Ornithinimicrobium ciconiae]|uniref:Na+/H+ antiporter NhaC-like C-terminal domain-containing protein n=1 Tax=Ornithinimicrobium ciconiae TaxID=2594265 RepID=A0A516G913_9MICO|nr:hypothetical protein FNH13_06380 [Ornithinimicrobium ciconiae]